jgi:hypothetical protein
MSQGSSAELGTARNDLGIVTHRMRQSKKVSPWVFNPQTSNLLESPRRSWSFYAVVIAGPGFRGYSL